MNEVKIECYMFDEKLCMKTWTLSFKFFNEIEQKNDTVSDGLLFLSISICDILDTFFRHSFRDRS